MRALKAVRVAVLLAAIPAPGAGQTRVTGTHLSALPALNYNSDEGFGYGLVGGVYAYGDGTRDPYRWAVEPLLFFTTNGRRQVRVYVDLPYVRDRLRLTVLGAWDRDCCYPYYGLGNATPYDPALAAPDSGPSFYSYRRERVSGEADVQWRAWRGVRVLVGFAAHRNAATSRAPDTRFALDSLAGVITGEATAVSAGLKVGLVLDTRDQERDPTRGIWGAQRRSRASRGPFASTRRCAMTSRWPRALSGNRCGATCPSRCSPTSPHPTATSRSSADHAPCAASSAGGCWPRGGPSGTSRCAGARGVFGSSDSRSGPAPSCSWTAGASGEREKRSP
jgi:hypothetical protein